MAVPNLPGWQQMILRGIGAPATPENVRYLNAWAQAEGGGAANNPFNTTQPGFGTTGSYNSVGVRNYDTPQHGIQATINTLKNGHYQTLLNALMSGKSAMADAQAEAQTPWGTGSLIEKVLGGRVTGGQVTPGHIGAHPGTLPGGASMSTARSPRGSNQNSLFQQMLAQQLLSSAGQVVSGAQSPAQGGAGLVALALARQQAQAADQTFGPGGVVGAAQGRSGGRTGGATAPRPAGHAGPTFSGYQGKSLDGQLPMVFGGKSPYSNIRFGSQVDWQHVNPRLLKAINDVARSQGKVVDVNSGYRSNQYSQKVGGFAGDPHSRGLAVDAYVNGVPVNKAINPSVWQAYGVRPGSSFTYNGSPDWEHLDLL